MHLPRDMANLPPKLLRRLLMGSSGRLHLHATAKAALKYVREPGDLFSRIGGDLLLTAWGENPFDGNCAAAIATLGDKLPRMDTNLLPVIKSVLAHWRPDVTPEAQAAMAGEPDEQAEFLRSQVKRAPRNLFWRHHVYELCRITGDWSLLTSTAENRAMPVELAPLFDFASANALLASGEPVTAAGMYRRCALKLPLPIVQERLTTALLRSGNVQAGAEGVRQCAEARPWNVGLWLRLHDLIEGVAQEAAAPQGRTAILAYSWNKAADLAETLDSLETSLLDDVIVRVLDNGSDDDTAEVVRRFADRFGADRAELVSLPVNVGAPAARNWLMHLPDVQSCDYAAYIDDDVFLPSDWLLRLGAAARRYPDAAVWGCKVVDHAGPSRVQCGEHHLSSEHAERETSLMSTIMLQDGDFGQADYLRPCASVTGCVHLFRTDRLLEGGGFDLRFSPTQYDDLERDLRMVHEGGYAVYQGFLSIRHKRSSGKLSDAGRPESMGAAANLCKLMAKYSSEDFERMADAMDRATLEDFQRKTLKLTG